MFFLLLFGRFFAFRGPSKLVGSIVALQQSIIVAGMAFEAPRKRLVDCCTEYCGRSVFIDQSLVDLTRCDPISSRCRCQVYKTYWGVLSETLLTWTIAVAAARNNKWFSSRVYYSGLSFSSKRYYFGLGKCSAYGDVDSEDLDDACSISECRTRCLFATCVQQ